jgi:glycosyltransferase involved in cell wall biosynthesis
MQHLKIAVNTRLLLKDRMDGIGWFTYECLKRITKNNPEHQFYFIFDRPYHEDFIFSSNITPIVTGPVTRHPWLIKYWFDHTISKVLSDIKPHLFLSPDGFLSHRYNQPSYVVIHDLNFEHFPKFMAPAYRKLYRKNFRTYATLAKGIGTVSEFSKQDISKTYHIPLQKIDVLYCGLNDHFTAPVHENAKKQAISITQNKPYFLFTGTFHPRKNLPRLITAFENFKKRTNSTTMLILAGNNKWASKETKQALATSIYSKDIVVTGRVPAEVLVALTRKAKALVFISLFEGFGIPLLEAAAAKIPIISSKNSAMEEIAGDAALLVNPRSIKEITSALKKMDENDALRLQYAEMANRKLSIYSWEKTAGRLWESIIKTITA